MSSKQLFDNDSDSDENESGFKTNKDYAKSYNKFRSKELLKKVKDQAQSTGNKASNSSDDSSSDSDSTDNETVDPKFDEAFFQALATLKKKDSSTYDANVKFFEEFDGIKASGEKKSSKALTVKDYERKILLEKGGIYEDEEDDNGTDLRPPSPSYNQEQMNIKNAFKKVIEDDDDEDDNEWGGIFRKREKTKEEEATEEEQYIKWLTGQEANIGAKAQELKPLKEYWNSPKLSKDEKFLRDYILSNGYSKSDKDDVPTYDEIVGDDNLEISEDEAELERQAEFEHKFNFRFEEPDNEFIKRYPRTIEHSVRKQDNRRKEKRVEVKERKLNEKKEKMKELEMINAIRKREIEEKIKKLKEVTGEETIPFNDDDIDGDFDPDEYDRKMNEIFNNEYYQVDEGETKPDCPDIEDLKVDDWDNYDPSKDQADDNLNDGHCEDDDFVMDCDYDPEQQRKSLQDELIENSRDNRKRRKRRSKFVEMLKTEKPVFNPDDEKTYGEYLDEYYKLDYEDIIGDTPCRFKYVETVPNDFGLTVEEILLAKNKELNAWASLKKATQIRPDHVELNEVKTFKNKARNEYLKRKILPSLYGEGSDDDDDDDQDGKANVPAETTIPNRKRKISEEETEQEEPKKSDQETTAQKDKKKAKTKIAQPAIKVTGDSGKTSKKVIVKETLTVTVQPEAKSKIEKPTKQSVEKKQNILMPKKVSTAKLNVQKKQAATIPDPKRKANKRNTDSTLLKKGGITKKTVRPQHSKSATSTISNKPSISDERLRAFGLNPKKFHKKLKYGNKSTGSATSTSSSKKDVTKNSKLDKMNQKKIKKKLLKVLGS